ncbi:M24 family metallopeptidase [Thiothrix eikelboomii]|uniref:M24 family metallopeptidase n=1 Tax=Thiothrix eikelboomii TaxID=92487 RepID=UPI003BB0EB85
MKASRRRFEPAEYLERQTKTRTAMEAAGLELLIVTDPSNIGWLTGFDGWSFYVHQCVVIGNQGELFWFGRGIDAPTAYLTTDLPPSEVLSYPDHYVQTPELHPMEYLATIFKQRQLHRRRIGVEKDNYYFSARAFEALATSLPTARFQDATGLVNWQRAIKSPQEIIYLQRAGQVIEQVYQRVLEVAEPGMRKNELAAEILHASTWGTAEHYGDYTAIVPLMGMGEEASACHLTWDGTRLEPDQGMFLELAAAHHRYHCPLSRTLYFGKPPAKYRKLEQVIAESIERLLPLFKPGNTCGELAQTFFNYLHHHGYEKNNRCGYSIGMSYPPDWGERTMSLRAEDSSILQAGMCFHFMPGMWFEDWGFEMTESILVTAQGGACLANVPRQILVK